MINLFKYVKNKHEPCIAQDHVLVYLILKTKIETQSLKLELNLKNMALKCETEFPL